MSIVRVAKTVLLTLLCNIGSRLLAFEVYDILDNHYKYDLDINLKLSVEGLIVRIPKNQKLRCNRNLCPIYHNRIWLRKEIPFQ